MRFSAAALRLVDGGDAVAGEAVDDRLVGAADVLDDDVSHQAAPSVWLAFTGGVPWVWKLSIVFSPQA